MNDLTASAGAILKQHREALGVSRKALAEQHHLAANTLREVELGLGNPTLDRLERLARDVYGVELGIVAASGPAAAVARTPIARAQ